MPVDAATSSAAVAGTLSATLELQRKAYRAHPVPSLRERRADLKQLLRFVLESKEAMADAVNTDFGHRSRHETMLTEIRPVLETIRHAIRHVGCWMKPQRRRIDRLIYGLASNRVIPQPVGVIGIIVPWNFPIGLSFTPLIGAITAGNRVMVKMSENSRHLSRLLVETAPRYFPLEKLHFFEETGGVGIEFSKLPFDHLFFTGSGTTGRAVMTAAAQSLCPVTLELGGKAPAILCEDFNLHLAAKRILFVKYLSAGQICTTVDYAFVPEARVRDFVQAARAIVPRRYPELGTPDYTSIIDRRSYDRLVGALEEARAAGAEVICLLPGAPFDPENHRIAPHIVIGAPPQSALMQREIFGPILPLVPYRTLDEVIAQINARPRPLALYPFSNSKATIARLIEHVMSGGVTVNDALMHVSQEDLPFGGVGESGMGQYHGREGFNTFSKLRPVFHQARWSSVALIAPPYRRFANYAVRFFTN